MRFWDSSAVVPLLITQTASPRTWTWLGADSGMVLWTLTPVEVVSAIRRLVRDGAVGEHIARSAETRLEQLVGTCHVIADIERVKSLTTRLLRVHPLRAADGLQLGAALHWVEGHPEGETLHTLDQRLALAAEREGFIVPAV